MEPAGCEAVPADHVQLDIAGSGRLAEAGVRGVAQTLVQRDVLHADEATLQVLREPGKSAQSKSYMWLYRTGGDSEHPIVLYEYSPNRKPKNAEVFLEGFQGWLHADGYPGYHSLPEQIRVVGCWLMRGANLMKR